MRFDGVLDGEGSQAEPLFSSANRDWRRGANRKTMIGYRNHLMYSTVLIRPSLSLQTTTTVFVVWYYTQRQEYDTPPQPNLHQEIEPPAHPHQTEPSSPHLSGKPDIQAKNSVATTLDR